MANGRHGLIRLTSTTPGHFSPTPAINAEGQSRHLPAWTVGPDIAFTGTPWKGCLCRGNKDQQPLPSAAQTIAVNAAGSYTLATRDFGGTGRESGWRYTDRIPRCTLRLSKSSFCSDHGYDSGEPLVFLHRLLTSLPALHKRVSRLAGMIVLQTKPNLNFSDPLPVPAATT